jgi:hypothetical protein
MSVQIITREDFLDFAYRDTEGFMRSIAAGDAYVVKAFYPRSLIDAYRAFLRDWAVQEQPSWHPCLDGVPDYHRINDEYPESWVKARMHSFYIHRFNGNREWFAPFKEILELKNHLRNAPPDSNYDTLPSSGVISRITSHQYPIGGGYLAPHIDPKSDFALVQTIVQASDMGTDFESGGLYYCPSASEPVYLDQYSESGDLFVLTPDAEHGVAPVDPEKPTDWSTARGRWMILPVVIRSDYNMDPATKPRQVQRNPA